MAGGCLCLNAPFDTLTAPKLEISPGSEIKVLYYIRPGKNAETLEDVHQHVSTHVASYLATANIRACAFRGTLTGFWSCVGIGTATSLSEQDMTRLLTAAVGWPWLSWTDAPAE